MISSQAGALFRTAVLAWPASRTVERTGWLLDVYEDPLGGLVVWFLDEMGERRRLRQRFQW